METPPALAWKALRRVSTSPVRGPEAGHILGSLGQGSK